MKRQFIILIIFIFGMFFGLVKNVQAACSGASPTWQTTSDYDSVKSCVDQAKAGDTINVSAVSATWTATVIINKPLTIAGNNTVLTAGTHLDTGFFNISGFTSNDLMRITGFNFQLVDFATYGNAIAVNNAEITKLRIDHNEFHFGYNQIILGGAKGVIDHNYLYNGRSNISFTAGSRAQADASWESMAAGTADALFIEDNHFIDDANYPGIITQEKVGTANGGKLVVRHNDFNFDNIPDAAADHDTQTPVMTHGSACGGCNAESHGYWQTVGSNALRGQAVVEVYNNTMHGKRIDFMMEARGSANFIHDNAIVGTVRNYPRFYFYEEEQDHDYVGAWQPARTSWPAEDQVHNTFIWNNTYNGNALGVSNSDIAIGDSSVNYIQFNHDYFLHAPCKATDKTDGHGNDCTYGKEIFVCANGVTNCNGASNTYPTDGNTYPTLGTMVFTPNVDNAYVGYQPYQYPHPLTLLDQACTTKGDFTCNGYSISDLQTMISIILGTDSTTSRTQADMNNDTQVNISDLQLLINKVLGIN